MFIPFISNFKITLSSNLSMYYFSQVIMPSIVLLLCRFTTLNNNVIYTFIYFLHNLHRESPCLLSIFALTRFVLILWFRDAIISLYVSLSKFPFWSQAQHWSLLTSLVCLNYWPWRTFSSQSSNLFSLFDHFIIRAASKPYILSPPATCIDLSILPWR